MALLSTNLKGRNVTIQRLQKQETSDKLDDLKTETQKLDKDAKVAGKEKKKQDKMLKKQTSSALKALEDYGTVAALASFWADTCPIAVPNDCQTLKNNAIFKKTDGVNSEQQLLDILVTDSTSFVGPQTPGPSIPPTPLMDLFIEFPAAFTTTFGTNTFFPSTEAAQEFKTTHLQEVILTSEAKIPLDTKVTSIATKKKTAESQVNKITNYSPNNKFKPITLVGVQRIGISNSTSIGTENGLIVPFLQGWYNNPIKIEITGKSYMGAFEKIAQFFPETGDTTKDDLQNLFLDNDDLFKQNQGLEVELTIQNEGVYQGFITDCNFDEDIAEPFLINYSISFMVFRNSEKSKANGEKRFKFDLSAALNIVPANKGLSFLLSSVTPKLNG